MSRREKGRATSAKVVFMVGAVLVCVLPAAAINLQYGLQEGRSYAHVGAMVALVFGAALSGIALERARGFPQFVIAALCLIAFSLCNVLNALGLVATHRAAGTGQAETQIVRYDTLVAQKTRVGSALNSAQTSVATTNLLDVKREKAALERHRLFIRSKQCSDADRPDSLAHCAKWEAAKAQLAAHAKVEALTGKLDAVEAELRTIEKPDVTDAQAAGLAVILNITPDAAGVLADGFLAIAIELLAGLGPFLIMIIARPASAIAPRRATRKLPETVSPESNAPEVDALQDFIASLVPSERWMPNKDLIARYSACCAQLSQKAKAQPQFSAALERAGFARRKVDGRLQWQCKERAGLKVVNV